MSESSPLNTNRRNLLGAGLALGAGAGLITSSRETNATPHTGQFLNAARLGLKPSKSRNQSRLFQRAIDQASQANTPLFLPPGNYRTSQLKLRPGTHIIGVPHASRILYAGGGTFLTGDDADNITLEGLHIDGNHEPLDLGSGHDALLSIRSCRSLSIANTRVTGSLVNGISMRRSSARLSNLDIGACTNTGIFALDSNALTIDQCEIHYCGNNGVQIWRSKPGKDGTIITACHIHHIDARAGGSGQSGNGINVFRSGNVTLSSNRISDCAFSAIRGNAASNIIMTANNCSRLGEVALYAEFGFEGALIANNIVDDAATGISVTNFNEGGRLAVVQGNLIRNLKRRELSVDKRGTGIAVEADTVVTSNVIENAATMGIAIGWGEFMRNVSATGNLIRSAPIGIGISATRAAGSVQIASNMISGAPGGGIRAMNFDEPTGPDLARTSERDHPNFAITGNVVT